MPDLVELLHNKNKELYRLTTKRFPVSITIFPDGSYISKIAFQDIEDEFTEEELEKLNKFVVHRTTPEDGVFLSDMEEFLNEQ